MVLLMADSRPFELGYVWELEGNAEDAFHFLSHIATWPSWWPQIVSVETSRPDEDDVIVGDSARMRAKSFLPYTLDWFTTVAKINPPFFIEVTSEVKLGKKYGMKGVVSFEIEQLGELLRIVNRQKMVSDKPVPGFMRPLVNWIFNFNHDFAMKRGKPGLARAMNERARSRA